MGVTVHRYSVLFWSDGNALESNSGDFFNNLLNILKTTDLVHLFKGVNFMGCELYLNKNVCLCAYTCLYMSIRVFVFPSPAHCGDL